jgi:hypothetical protein
MENSIATMSAPALAQVQKLSHEVSKMTDKHIPVYTDHVVHGGMYYRTLHIPPNSLVCGVLIKKPTALLINGDLTVYLDMDAHRFTGHTVLPAFAGRQTAVYAHAETFATLMMRTDAETVEEAERDMTDDYEMLQSRLHPEFNTQMVTGV